MKNVIGWLVVLAFGFLVSYAVIMPSFQPAAVTTASAVSAEQEADLIALGHIVGEIAAYSDFLTFSDDLSPVSVEQLMQAGKHLEESADKLRDQLLPLIESFSETQMLRAEIEFSVTRVDRWAQLGEAFYASLSDANKAAYQEAAARLIAASRELLNKYSDPVQQPSEDTTGSIK